MRSTTNSGDKEKSVQHAAGVSFFSLYYWTVGGKGNSRSHVYVTTTAHRLIVEFEITVGIGVTAFPIAQKQDENFAGLECDIALLDTGLETALKLRTSTNGSTFACTK